MTLPIIFEMTSTVSTKWTDSRACSPGAREQSGDAARGQQRHLVDLACAKGRERRQEWRTAREERVHLSSSRRQDTFMSVMCSTTVHVAMAQMR